MADIGEHIKFPVRYVAVTQGLLDADGRVIAYTPWSQFNFDRYDIIGEYICAALNEKHQRDMAGTICTNCGLPGDAPWQPCKEGYDHQWQAVEGERK